jgi:hypothetical protein
LSRQDERMAIADDERLHELHEVDTKWTLCILLPYRVVDSLIQYAPAPPIVGAAFLEGGQCATATPVDGEYNCFQLNKPSTTNTMLRLSLNAVNVMLPLFPPSASLFHRENRVAGGDLQLPAAVAVCDGGNRIGRLPRCTCRYKPYTDRHLSPSFSGPEYNFPKGHSALSHPLLLYQYIAAACPNLADVVVEVCRDLSVQSDAGYINYGCNGGHLLRLRPPTKILKPSSNRGEHM